MRTDPLATDSRRIGVAATVRSPMEILKMRLSVTRYLMAVLAFAGAICNGELSRLTESQRREFVEWMRKLGRLIA